MNQQTEKIARHSLRRIVASAGFVRSLNMQRLLTFLVEAALSGRETSVSALEIAREALGRGPKFDPSQDPVVRVECTRLRRLLDIYYETDGRDDVLRFVLPRGSYRILIVPRDSAATLEMDAPDAPVEEAVVAPVTVAALPDSNDVSAQMPHTRRTYGAIAIVILVFLLIGTVALAPSFDRSVSWRRGPLPTASITPRPPRDQIGVLPRVRVQPFRYSQGDAALALAAQHLEIGLRDALARFDMIEVMAEPADGPIDATQREVVMRSPPLPPGRPAEPIDYLVTTDISRGEQGEIRIAGRIVNARSGVVLSVSEYAEAAGGAVTEQRETRHAMLRRAVSRIAGPYGVIYSNELRMRATRDPLVDTYACYLLAYETWKAPTPQREARVISCLEDALIDEPDNFRALALLAYTEVTLVREQRSYGQQPADLRRAAERARKAVELAPFSALAHQALFGVNKLADDPGFARMIASRVLALNAYDLHALGDIGAFNIMKGDFDRGETQLRDAFGHTPQPPEWYWGPMGLAALSRDDRATVVAMGNRVTTTGYALGVIIKVLAAHMAGDVARIAGWETQLRSVLPTLESEPHEALRRIGLTEPAREVLRPYLQRYGLV